MLRVQKLVHPHPRAPLGSAQAAASVLLGAGPRCGERRECLRTWVSPAGRLEARARRAPGRRPHHPSGGLGRRLEAPSPDRRRGRGGSPSCRESVCVHWPWGESPGCPRAPGGRGRPGNSGLGSSCCAPWFLRSVGAPPPRGGDPGHSTSPRGMERGPWVNIPCPLQIPNCPGSEASAGLAGLCSCTPAALGTTWLGRSWSLRGARNHAEP